MTMAKGDVLEITRANIDECRIAASSLRANYERLATMVKRYPVMIDFAGYRVVFTAQAHIDEVIVAIDLKVAAALA
jgi:hypothetical protein